MSRIGHRQVGALDAARRRHRRLPGFHHRYVLLPPGTRYQPLTRSCGSHGRESSFGDEAAGTLTPSQIGWVSSWLILPPNYIVRSDQTLVKIEARSSPKQEVQGMLFTLKSWKMLLVRPPIPSGSGPG